MRAPAPASPGSLLAASGLGALALVVSGCCLGAPTAAPAPSAEQVRPEERLAQERVPSIGELLPAPPCDSTRCEVADANAVRGDGRDAFLVTRRAILRASDGEPALVVVATHGGAERARIALDATHVYWTHFGTLRAEFRDGTVSRAPRSGGPTELLARGAYVGALAVDGEHVYWADGGLGATVVHRAARDGSGATSLLTASHVPAIAAAGGRLYVVRDLDLVTIATVGAEPVTLHAGSPTDGASIALAADEAGVFAALQETAGSGSLRYFAADGHTVHTVGRGLGVPIALALDGDRVLVARSHDTLGAVARDGGEIVPLGRGEAPEQVTATERFVWALVGDPPVAVRYARP